MGLGRSDTQELVVESLLCQPRDASSLGNRSAPRSLAAQVSLPSQLEGPRCDWRPLVPMHRKLLAIPFLLRRRSGRILVLAVGEVVLSPRGRVPSRSTEQTEQKNTLQSKKMRDHLQVCALPRNDWERLVTRWAPFVGKSPSSVTRGPNLVVPASVSRVRKEGTGHRIISHPGLSQKSGKVWSML